MHAFLDRFRKPLLLTAAVLLIVLVSVFQSTMNKDRRELGLTNLDPLDNAPPVLTLTTQVLGGFRGLIANALWVRANDLQDEGKYFEMVQLADWITKLQPRITTVWYHLAWNMAYNISVKFRTPEERWMWVRRGIELLRDEGLVYNPTDTMLYRELSWFFQHKMGANLDDAHYYYKTVWINLMKDVLGPGPDSFQELLDPQTEDARTRLEILRNKYRMDPAIMAEVDEVHGPLDWRLPETHGIYWAFMGLRKGEDGDKMAVRRSIYQCMQMAFHRGRLVENSFADSYELSPNLDIIPKVDADYLESMEQEPEMRDHIDGAHRNFLKKAVYFLYLHARMTEAQDWFAKLKELYPQAVPANQTLDEYAVVQAQEDVGETSAVDTTAMIEGYIARHFYMLALDDSERALGAMNLAKSIYNRYKHETRKSEQRVRLRSFEEFRIGVLNDILNPENNANPQMVAQLKTVLGIPPDQDQVPMPKAATANAEAADAAQPQ